MKRGYEFAQKNKIAPLKKWVGKNDCIQSPSSLQITFRELFMVALLSFIIGVTLAVTMASPEFVKKVQHKELF